MATATRICKVCGKAYKYCKTWLGTKKFRYQDVACSPECGSIYFANIAISRGETTEDTSTTEVKKMKKASKKSSKKVSVEENTVTAEQEASEANVEDTVDTVADIENTAEETIE